MDETVFARVKKSFRDSDWLTFVMYVRYVFDSKDKADLFHDFFVSQTYLPIENAVLPELSPNLNSTLSNIIVTEVEVAN